MNKKRYRKGHFIGIGVAMGIPLGLPFGVAIGNIALGPALGLPIGLAIGIAMEKKLNTDPIEPTEDDKKKQKIWSYIGITIGLMLAIGLAILYFKAKNN